MDSNCKAAIKTYSMHCLISGRGGKFNTCCSYIKFSGNKPLFVLKATIYTFFSWKRNACPTKSTGYGLSFLARICHLVSFIFWYVLVSLNILLITACKCIIIYLHSYRIILRFRLFFLEHQLHKEHRQ